MGKGNWRPCRPARHYNPETFGDQLYVQLLSVEEAEDTNSLDRFDVIETLHLVLEEAVPSCLLHDKQPFSLSLSRDERCLLWNRHVLITVDTDSDIHHYGIGVSVNPQAYQYGYGGLAEKSASMIFEKVKQRLLAAYPNNVSVRTSAWTSARLAA